MVGSNERSGSVSYPEAESVLADLLDKLSAPPLDALVVEVEEPASPTPEDLIERLHQELRQRATRTERSEGSLVDWNDEVECDMAMLYQGRFVPGSVASSTTLEMRSLIHLPGLVENLIGTPVGSARTFELTIGPEYPFEEWRGKTVTTLVEVRRVVAVESPQLDDVGALQSAGLGRDLEEALETIATIIDAEQGEQLLKDASELAMSVLAERLAVEIPDILIDRELHEMWSKAERPLLQAKNFEAEIVEQARLDYLAQGPLRRQVAHNLKVALTISKLVDAYDIKPSDEQMRNLLEEVSELADLSLSDALQHLDEQQKRNLVEAALHLEVKAFVMERAKIRVIETP